MNNRDRIDRMAAEFVLPRPGIDYSIESRDNGNTLSLVSTKDGRTLYLDFSQQDDVGFPNKFLRQVHREIGQVANQEQEQLSDEIEAWLRVED